MATHFSAVGQIRQFAGEAAADIRELMRPFQVLCKR